MECEDPGFFHSPENWVCLGRTDRRRQLTERYLYTVPGLAYVVQVSATLPTVEGMSSVESKLKPQRLFPWL